ALLGETVNELWKLWSQRARRRASQGQSGPPRNLQRALTKLIEKRRFLALFDVPDSDTTEPLRVQHARLRSLACRSSATWLTVLPTDASLRVSDSHVDVLIAQRLGLHATRALRLSPANMTCAMCHKPFFPCIHMIEDVPPALSFIDTTR